MTDHIIAPRHYRHALDGFGSRLSAVPDDQLTVRTRCCPDWNVTDLVRHVIEETSWAGSLLAGLDSAAATEHALEGRDDPLVERWHVVASRVEEVLGAGQVPTDVLLPAGKMPTLDYLAEVCCDTVIHTWDLASATSGDVVLDAELVELSSRWFDSAEDRWRAAGAIGERADVPDDADPQTRLLARFGRSP